MSAYESTSVSVEKSQSEIRRLLATHGCERFAFGEDNGTGRTWAIMEFAHAGLLVRIRVALKPPDEGEIARKARRSRTRSPSEVAFEANEQEARRIWRVIAWNLKARMVAVDEGVETFAQAFLPHLVNPDTNTTLYEQLAQTGKIELDPRHLPELMESTG